MATTTRRTAPPCGCASSPSVPCSSSSPPSSFSPSSPTPTVHQLPSRFIDPDDDLPQEECGIFGVFSHANNAALTTFFALHALQHRGQEMAGIATFDGSTVHTHKGMGLVGQIFNEDHIKGLQGHLGVGHTRYSTAGGKSLNNAQPFFMETDIGKMAVAHNGQLTRQKFLRRLLLARGTGLFTNSDSEVLAQMLAHPASGNSSMMQMHAQMQSPRAASPAPPSPMSPTTRRPGYGANGHHPLHPLHHAQQQPYVQPSPTRPRAQHANPIERSITPSHPQHNGGTNGYHASPSSQTNGTQQYSPPRHYQQNFHSSQPLPTLSRVPSYDDTSIAYDGLVTIHHRNTLMELEEKSGGRRDDWQRRLVDLMSDAEGAYALVVLVPGAVYGCRDRYGIRPLCLGEKKNADGSCNYALSSESCGFGPIGYSYVREIRPGEIVRLNAKGVTSLTALAYQDTIPPALCVFEYVYFARPDSLIEDQLVHTVRQRFGRRLAVESPVVADIVAGVPDSSIAAAIGFSMQSHIPFMEVLCKNRYIGRTFIQPDQAMRENSIRLKFNPLSANLDGKRIILVDDSMVRGNTLKQLIPLLKAAGAVEVHIRISSPILRHPCYMGVDIGTYHEILATHSPSVESMAQYVGADSLQFLSHEGMLDAVTEGLGSDRHGGHPTGHCTACFSGEYPVTLDIEDEARSMNRGNC